jgi:hypothetical protein
MQQETQTVQQKEKMHFWSNCSKQRKQTFRKTVCFLQTPVMSLKTKTLLSLKSDQTETQRKQDQTTVHSFL